MIARPDTGPVGKRNRAPASTHLARLQPDLIFVQPDVLVGVAIRANVDLPPVVVESMIFDQSRSASWRARRSLRDGSCQAVGLAGTICPSKGGRRTPSRWYVRKQIGERWLAIEPRATRGDPGPMLFRRILPCGRRTSACRVRCVAPIAECRRDERLVAEIWPRIRQTLPQASSRWPAVGTEQVARDRSRHRLESSACPRSGKRLSPSQLPLPVRAASGNPAQDHRGCDVRRSDGFDGQSGRRIEFRRRHGHPAPRRCDSFATPAFPAENHSLRKSMGMRAHQHAMSHHDSTA